MPCCSKPTLAQKPSFWNIQQANQNPTNLLCVSQIIEHQWACREENSRPAEAIANETRPAVAVGVAIHSTD